MLTKATMIIFAMLNGEPHVDYRSYEVQDTMETAVSACIKEGEELLDNNPQLSYECINNPVQRSM